jgi:hypothetical protein
MKNSTQEKSTVLGGTVLLLRTNVYRRNVLRDYNTTWQLLLLILFSLFENKVWQSSLKDLIL